MTFEGLNAVLTQLKKTQWQEQQAIERLLKLWPEIVGAEVSAQTRPVSLSPQGILQVAAASGVWAQNLAFERVRLLVKVRSAWNPAVKDIHFSPRQWHRSGAAQPLSPQADSPAIQQAKLARSLTSPLPTYGKKETKNSQALPQDAQAAFTNWANRVRQNANQHASRCPICDCLTPTIELSRWGRCALCTSRPESG